MAVIDVDSLKHKDVWSTKYKDVTILIEHHGVSEHEPHGIWCYYLVFRLDCIDFPDQPDNFEPYGYWDNWLNRWFMQHFDSDVGFHGGITYSEKQGDNLVKVGCDYNHLFDQDMKEDYNQTILLSDAKDTVDAFLRKYPDYLERREDALRAKKEK